jgi:ubiquinone/menaquinone biosynthesis C-methylase UbiE
MIDVVAPMKVADLIDLGTGTGRVLEVLSAYVERGVGVDLSREMLAVARANLEAAGIHNCHVRQGDILSLPFAEASADLVTIHQVLHYLGEPGEAVAEAARLLRPHGHLLIVDFTPHELEFLRTDHAHRRLGFNDAEVGAWCKGAGLTMACERELPPDGRDVGCKLTVKLWLARRAESGTTGRRRARA